MPDCADYRPLCKSAECLQWEKVLAIKKTSRLSKILCETCKAYMEKFHEYKGWKSGMCYEQILNINQPKWFMPIIKHPETEKGRIFYDLE